MFNRKKAGLFGKICFIVKYFQVKEFRPQTTLIKFLLKVTFFKKTSINFLLIKFSPFLDSMILSKK